MQVLELFLSNFGYKILDVQIMYPLFLILGGIGLLLSYKRWWLGIIWLVLFVSGFAFMHFQGISENLPDNLLADPTFSNKVNSYISVTIGILLNLAGLFIKKRKKILL